MFSIFCVPSGLAQQCSTPRVLYFFDHLGIFEVVLVLELLLRVEVVERAEELVEPVRGRQRLVRVAQVVLAELRGHVALLLEQFGDRHVTRLQPFLRAGQADLQHARPEARLAGDETGAAGRAALLAVPVGEQGAFLGDAVDIGSPVAHLAEVVRADVPVADVVAPENQDVWFLRSHHSSFRLFNCHRSSRTQRSAQRVDPRLALRPYAVTAESSPRAETLVSQVST